MNTDLCNIRSRLGFRNFPFEASPGLSLSFRLQGAEVVAVLEMFGAILNAATLGDVLQAPVVLACHEF